jgi:hypothetical protein
MRPACSPRPESPPPLTRSGGVLIYAAAVDVDAQAGRGALGREGHTRAWGTRVRACSCPRRAAPQTSRAQRFNECAQGEFPVCACGGVTPRRRALDGAHARMSHRRRLAHDTRPIGQRGDLSGRRLEAAQELMAVRLARQWVRQWHGDPACPRPILVEPRREGADGARLPGPDWGASRRAGRPRGLQRAGTARLGGELRLAQGQPRGASDCEPHRCCVCAGRGPSVGGFSVCAESPGGEGCWAQDTVCAERPGVCVCVGPKTRLVPRGPGCVCVLGPRHGLCREARGVYVLGPRHGLCREARGVCVLGPRHGLCREARGVKEALHVEARAQEARAGFFSDTREAQEAREEEAAMAARVAAILAAPAAQWAWQPEQPAAASSRQRPPAPAISRPGSSRGCSCNCSGSSS